MSILIKNGTLLTASETFESDLLVEGEQISRIGRSLDAPGAQVVDASGKLIMPGGIDPHTHFDLPMFGTVSSDDHYTGHKAAAFGGTTTVIDFVPQEAGTLRQSVGAWRAKADGKAAVEPLGRGDGGPIEMVDVAGLAVVGALPDTTDATAANQPRSAAPSQAGVVSQMLSANAADTRNPNQKSGFTQRGASPVNLFHN